MEAVAHSRGEVQSVQTRTTNGTVPSLRAAISTTTGWRPSCKCYEQHGENPRQEWAPFTCKKCKAVWPCSMGRQATVPATVLDPFAGSGTTGMVANHLSRRAVLIDLNGEYLGQVLERNRQAPLGLGA